MGFTPPVQAHLSWDKTVPSPSTMAYDTFVEMALMQEGRLAEKNHVPGIVGQKHSWPARPLATFAAGRGFLNLVSTLVVIASTCVDNMTLVEEAQ